MSKPPNPDPDPDDDDLVSKKETRTPEEVAKYWAEHDGTKTEPVPMPNPNARKKKDPPEDD